MKTLNDITPEMVALLRGLDTPARLRWLEQHVEGARRTAFLPAFLRDVVDGGARPETWGHRDLLVTIEPPPHGALTTSVAEIRAALAPVAGERWWVLASDDLSDDAWGAPGILVRHAPYWWRALPGTIANVVGDDALCHVLDFEVAARRWIALSAARRAALAGVDLVEAEVCAAAGVSRDVVTEDGLIALGALCREARLPFDPATQARGFVGPAAWYADRPDTTPGA